MTLDADICYRALLSRDPRFDGRVFVGVRSTGIYCRPVCPASPPNRENCSFYPSAAAAQTAGFRPCLRCRPETAPGCGPWRGTGSTVSRALDLIAEGGLDGRSVEALADRLGVGSRHLRRLFHTHLGASPMAVAKTRRVLFAKQLLHETSMPITEVAFAAGFGSVRRFNEVMLALFDRPPSALRRHKRATTSATAGVSLRLRYRGDYDWPWMLAWLQTRAIDGVESIENGVYHRTISLDGEAGSVSVAHLRPGALTVTLLFPRVSALPVIVARVRRVFDLHADVDAIGAHLATDPLLAPLVAAAPHLRCPGGWDGFELGLRAILGQQISVHAARKLAGKLVRIAGVVHGDGWLFPTPAQVAAADLSSLPMPGARRRALQALAEAALADPTLFRPLATLDETIARLRALRGVGDWTAHYIALRAAREPDAFPASDVGLLRALVPADAPIASRPTAAALRDHAESWRPWRAYAAQHLWAADERIP